MKCLQCNFINQAEAELCVKCGAKFPSSSRKDKSDTKTVHLSKEELLRGRTIAGRYRIIEELGKGGMGEVYRAYDKKIEEEVALKLLRDEVASNRKLVKRFRNELKIARKISHRNVCRLYDLYEDKHDIFISMEYIPGDTLKDNIVQEGVLPFQKALHIAVQICEGLVEAHRLGVIHRDLKPKNIMIDRDGNARILDFGIALSPKSKESSEVGTITGTFLYMSPEQIEGEDIDLRSDIYSLGVMLYEMVTGKTPFLGETAMDIALKHRTDVPKDPRSLVDTIPESLSQVILKCLEKKREDRYLRSEDLLGDLFRLEKGIPLASVYRRRQFPDFLVKERDRDEDVEKPVLVSREAELGKLNNYFERSLSGKGQLVFVTGEAGSGKTTLINEFALKAQEEHDDLIVASGNCNAQTGIGDPYLPFREVLSFLAGDIEARYAANAINRNHAYRLWNLIPLTAVSLLDAGPGLIDTFVSGSSMVARARTFASGREEWSTRIEKFMEKKAKAASSVNLQQSDLFEQYTRVLMKLAREHPILVMLDDLHWADAGSTRLLFHLGRRIEGSRIMILGTYRPSELALGRSGQRHPLEGVVNELRRDFGDFEVESWKGEDRDFVNKLLDSEPNKLGADFRNTLYRQTMGHPLFTVELLRGMRERGILKRDDQGDWIEEAQLDWETLPAKVEAVVAEHIGRLPEKLHDLLTAASVEGVDFTAEVIARMSGLDELKVVNLLSQDLDKKHRLVKAQGIIQMDGQRLSRYRFRHALFQKYLYNNLDQVERAYQHEGIGKELEILYGEHTQRIAVQLAHHFQVAGNIDKTILYLGKAGEQALRGYAYQEAMEFLREVIKLDSKGAIPGDPMRRARWNLQLGEAYLGLGQLPECRECFEHAIALQDRSIPVSLWRLIPSLLRQILAQVFHMALPSYFVGRLQRKKEVILDTARAYSHLAEICYYSQEKFSAIYSSLRALNLAERAGPSPDLARNYGHMGLAAGVISQHKLARKYYRKAREIAESVDPLHTMGYIEMIEAAYLMGVGKWEGTGISLKRAVDLFYSSGDWRRWEESLAVQGQMAFYQGKYEQSIKNYHTIYERSGLRGDPQNQSLGLVGKAINQLRFGKIDEAIAFLKKADIDALLDEHRFEKIGIYSALALAHLRRDELQLAKRAAEEALKLYIPSDTRFASLKSYPLVAEVFLSLWEASLDRKSEELDQIKNSCQKACRTLNRHARVFTIGQPSANLWQGLYDWLDGNFKKAWKKWKEGLVHAERLKMPYEQGLLHFEIGRHAEGDARQSHLYSAFKIFSSLKASYDEERVKTAVKNKEQGR